MNNNTSTEYPLIGTGHLVTLDIGNNGGLAFHSESGPLKIPTVTQIKKLYGRTGKTPSHMKIATKIEYVLRDYDIVTESATIGSSGIEPEVMRDIVSNSPHDIYLIPTRALKNFLKDNPEKEAPKKDADAAAYLYEIVTGSNVHLKKWEFTTTVSKLTRKYTSVRPYDKRDYQDPFVDEKLSILPLVEDLPESIRGILTKDGEYIRSFAFPIALSFEEKGAEEWKGFEKVTGLYGHGYPSFYRRNSINIMQSVGCGIADTRAFSTVTKEQRKQAWRITTRMYKDLHALVAGTGYPKGTEHP